MRVGIVADIHSNAEALKSVLERLVDTDEIWCLGDIVGYGPDPAECIDLIRLRSHRCIAGNHDLCVLQEIDASDFNPDALEACLWNKGHLSTEYLNYLRDLQLTIQPIPEVILAHGSPRNDIWEYILSSWQADRILSESKPSIVFVGHSHIPLMFKKAARAPIETIPLIEGEALSLDKEVKYLVNPGSIGQPRDGDPRASFMIFNTDDYLLKYQRVEYPIEVTRKKMRHAGLPISLADRLIYGM
ncbi:MAG: metallophosphoesterase family protein [Actinobacteria bacterium]|nr:metallophosphoesterase family protein [Actinomycetota bacterium]